MDSMKVFVVVVMMFVAVQSQGCPNACSSHGECSAADVCLCTNGWAGDDCSLSDVELRNSQTVEGRVETRQWKYFHVVANSQQSSLEFQVNQSGSGDIDAYVRADKYPTKRDYDFRDITTSKKIRFEISSPRGVYYLGVYGFLGADFSVMALLKTTCPNDCSGHGSCSYNGECSCRSGYMGDDCSHSVSPLEEGVTVSGDILNGQWLYYSYENTENTLLLTLQQPLGEDCDIYVKIGELPTMLNFEYRDTSVGNSELRIANAPHGTYYIGLFGFSTDSSYDLTLQAFSECPNFCSGTTHGSCSSTFNCNCQREYSGVSCERKTVPMTLDNRIESGHVSGNTWNYYHFETFTSNNVLVTLREMNEDADCDLYIKSEEDPTQRVFDYRDISQRSESQITLESPAVNTWYVGIYGYSSCDYQLSALITQKCPNDCTDEAHGICVLGHCDCKEGWTSADCSLRSNLLFDGEVREGSVKNGEFEYFTFHGRPGTEITVVLHETASQGSVWLFTSATGVPTISTFDHSDTETNSAIHRVTFTISETAIVYFGAHGSILAHSGVDYNFQIIAWQAHFE